MDIYSQYRSFAQSILDRYAINNLTSRKTISAAGIIENVYAESITTADDLISEAYLYLHDQSLPDTTENFKKAICKCFNAQNEEQIKSIPGTHFIRRKEERLE